MRRAFLKCVSILSMLVTSRLLGTEQHSLEHAICSVYAVHTETGEVLIDENSHLSLTPASCMKIVTTAAALQILGEDHRFETHLEYDGAIDSEGILQGNLYIRGGGDPCLGSDRIPGSLSWEGQIEAWAHAVQELGVRCIAGHVIGDDARWESARAIPSWAVEDVGNYYGAGACALSFHENSYSLVFKPGIIGAKPNIIGTDPPLSMLTFLNEVKTGPEGSGDQACIYGSEFSPIQCIRGTIPAAVDQFAIKGAIPNPAQYTADLLAKRLQEKGILVKQGERAQTKRKAFYTTTSPTVEEIVHWTNQLSINLYAEHLLKRMGEVVYGEGGADAGVRAVVAFWKSQNIDLAGFNMVDGSGLSRKNLVTAKQLVEILLKIKKWETFPSFLKSLSRKSTNIRAKSGSMSLIKGYAGYANNFAFAILVNQCVNPQVMNEKINSFLQSLDKK